MKRLKYVSILIIMVLVMNMVAPIISIAQTSDIEETETVEDESLDTETDLETEDYAEEDSEEQTEETSSEEVVVASETTEDTEDTTVEAEAAETAEVETVIDEEVAASSTTTEQTIADGVYKIKANVGTNMYLDIADSSTSSGANVQIYKKSSDENQKFQVTYLGDGYYTITSVHSNKVLDVANAGKTSGTNVWQYTSNGTSAQKWFIKDVGDGTYYIISKCNGLYLDVTGAGTSNGTNVQVYEGNETNAQKFIFEEVEQIVGEQTIADGVYKIKSKIASNRYLTVTDGKTTDGANIEIYSKLDVEYQEFQVTYLGDGYYTITAVHSGKVLDVDNAGTTNGTNVQQYTSNSTKAQKWVIKDAGDGYYYIISKCNDLYLDVSGGGTSKGTNIQIYEGNSTNAQKWIFEKVEEIEDGQTIEDGIYMIETALNSNRAIEVADASSKDGANIQLGTKSNVIRQVFYVTYLGDGIYSIETKVANKMLDVANAGKTSGTNVQQYTSNGTVAQKWIIRETGDGYYYIISSCNNLYLDVSGGSLSVGTNIQVYVGNYTSSQKFKFTSVNPDNLYDGTYRISTSLESSMALDISDGSTSDGANVQIWSSTTVLQQKFELEYVGDGYYTITSVNSGKVLDVAGAGTESGTNVQQYTYNGTDAQLWFIEETGDGYYYIISKCNGLYLDVYGGGTADGTNVQVYTGNETASQKFSFDEIYFGVDVSKYNGTIDFDTLVSSGEIDFMIARVGWYSESKGALQVDSQFVTNYSQAKSYDLPIGTYIYSYATSVAGAKEEAEALVEYFDTNGYSFDLPVFYDIEDSTYQGSLSAETKTNMCIAFGEVLQEAGYSVGIYTSKSWLTSEINVDDIPSDYTIWVASWGTNDGYVPEDIYKYTGDHDIWQYTSCGSVPGISGSVDISIAYSKIF